MIAAHSVPDAWDYGAWTFAILAVACMLAVKFDGWLDRRA